MDKREEILEALGEIEVLSTPVLSALQVLNNPDSTPDEIERVISVDPALTTTVLKFANSAYFGCSSKVHTVKEAAVRLGVGMISRMLYLSSSQSFSGRSLQGYGLSAGSLWDSMIAAAVATSLLEKHLGTKAPHYTFTAALLHNIGKLVMGNYLEVDADPICALTAQEELTFEQAEERILGINHAEVGAELLHRWSVPDEIVQVVRWHLDPEQCPGDKMAVDFVHVASTIAKLAGHGLGIDGLCYDVSRACEKRLGITSTVIEKVLCELPDELAGIESML